MDSSREELYSSLFDETVNTALTCYEGDVPNGNRILIKRECDQRFGSHYDRVFLQLFFDAESKGLITPGQKVLETTSGSAGVSFAGYGKILGYECFVALPEGGEKAREAAVSAHLLDSSHLIFTPADTYTSGFPKFLKWYLVRNKDVFFLNHSMGEIDRGNGGYLNNEITLRAMQEIASEVLDQNIDTFVSAVGNGSNLLGIGLPLAASTKTVAFETFQSAVAYELMYPGQYQLQYGIEPGSLSRHRLPGTSFNGIDFPHIKNALSASIVDDVVLVSDEKTDVEFAKLSENYNAQATPNTLPHWDTDLIHAGDLGRSSRAGLAVALKLAEQVEDQNILLIGYDKAERYDPN